MSWGILIILFSYFIQENEEDDMEEMMPSTRYSWKEQLSSSEEYSSKSRIWNEFLYNRLYNRGPIHTADVFFKSGVFGRPIEPWVGCTLGRARERFVSDYIVCREGESRFKPAEKFQLVGQGTI